MIKKKESNGAKDRTAFSREVGVRAARKLTAQRNAAQGRGVWFGLGMMGLIGWSVAVPTLLGAALGTWLDSRYTGRYSWTLMLLCIGLGLGSLNAWHWVAKENREIHKDLEESDE
jgi:ATP synthase protein I